MTEKFPAPTDQFVESEKFEGSFVKVSEADRRVEYLKLMDHVPVLKDFTYQCLKDAPTNRPTAGYICNQLEKYIRRLESEAPELAKQHNKDKVSLLQLLQYQESQLQKNAKLIIEDINKDKSVLNDVIVRKEEYITSLESQYQDYKSKFEATEFTIHDLNQDKESLLKQLEDIKYQMQNEIEANQKLTSTYENQVNQLTEEIKSKEEEVKHLILDNEGHKLRRSELEVEVIDLKDLVKTKQEELNKIVRKIKLLEQAAVNNPTSSEVHNVCMHSNVVCIYSYSCLHHLYPCTVGCKS